MSSPLICKARLENLLIFGREGRLLSNSCRLGLVVGIARNPGALGAIQGAMILGLAFMESLALFTLVIIFIKVK